MATMSNKIDFAIVISVNHANPNGDPLNGNRPRINYDGFGELSDVCIKRKIRNRLMQEGYSVFVQSDDNKVDSYTSLRARVEGEIGKEDQKDKERFVRAACEKWIDVRAFGQVFAYKGEKGGGDGASIPIRGPVTVQSAFSVVPVSDRVSSIQITKSVSGEGDGKKKASDTMGMKHRVDHGVYICYGSMNPQLADKTGFSDGDASAIKDALISIFRNDESSARPAGSMEVVRLYWWEHNSNIGQYSPARVHRSVAERVRVKDGVSEPISIGEYVLPEKDEIEQALPGLTCLVIDGE